MKSNIKLTTAQVNMVLHGLESSMEDYMDDYGGAIEKDNNARAKRENAKLQKLIDNITEQYNNQ